MKGRLVIMKKMLSLLLAVILTVGIIPTTVSAAEETTTVQELVRAIKQNSTAEIRDADGNLVETLDVDVKVQRLPSARSVGGGVTYAITCTAVADFDNHSGSTSKGGIMASATMVCTDAVGTNNILHQVYGSWSGDEADTENRKVVYSAYDVFDTQTDYSPHNDAPQSFSYAPTGFMGYTFRVRTYATITATRDQLYLKVSTDPNG